MNTKYLIVVTLLFVPFMASAWKCKVINKTGSTITNVKVMPHGLIRRLRVVGDLKDKKSVEFDFGLNNVEYIEWFDVKNKVQNMIMLQEYNKNIVFEIHNGFYTVNALKSGATPTLKKVCPKLSIIAD